MPRQWRTPLRFFTQTRPAAPVTEAIDVYGKGDGRIYSQDHSGIERVVSGVPSQHLTEVVVSKDNPGLTTNGLWIELDEDGTPLTFWINS